MIKEAHLLQVDLPFKKSFKHALSSRAKSGSVFVKLILDDGTVGYGESLPREYVTGETPRSVIEVLRDVVNNRVLGAALKDYGRLPAFIESLDIKGQAARCALELALLDACGKYFKSPVSAVIGEQFRNMIVYTGVIQAGSVADAAKMSLGFKLFGFHFIKVKVGMDNDLARLGVIRAILGRDKNIRVDANCAWPPDEAVEKINGMRRFNISAVEQPVAADDYEGMKKVADCVQVPVIADESMRGIEDAQRLARLKACGIFNIRISKCGGLLNSLKIADIARKNGIGVQLGCQVGESGILSAAGWHFASISSDISFCEGSYGRYLLKEDVTKEDMTIQRGGLGKAVRGPGLGVSVLGETLDRHVVYREVIRS